MRTNEERAGLVRKRTAELKRARKNRRQRGIDAAVVAACLLLVAGIATLMPELMADVAEGSVSHASGAASLVGSHAALGYILMGLLAFLLGMCVTVILYRLRRRNMHQHREDRDDGL